MIIGIGCDICQISRFKDNYEKLAKRLLTENEYAIYSDFTSEKRKIEFLAGRFSAKEAVVKALDVPKLVKDIEILNDENGNEVKFEFLDLVELDNEEYVVLLPVAEEGEEEEGEVVILKLEDTDEDSDEESYVGVDDEEILNKVFQIFKEKYKDDFNFVDED